MFRMFFFRHPIKKIRILTLLGPREESGKKGGNFFFPSSYGILAVPKQSCVYFRLLFPLFMFRNANETLSALPPPFGVFAALDSQNSKERSRRVPVCSNGTLTLG